VDVQDSRHDRVQAITGDTTKLKSVPSCYCSGGKILWKERDGTNDTGEMWATVLLMPNMAGEQLITTTPVAITPAPTEVDFDEGTVNVKTPSGNITANTLVLLIPGVDCCNAIELCP
jgi:hypothetical protein